MRLSWTLICLIPQCAWHHLPDSNVHGFQYTPPNMSCSSLSVHTTQHELFQPTTAGGSKTACDYENLYIQKYVNRITLQSVFIYQTMFLSSCSIKVYDHLPWLKADTSTDICHIPHTNFTSSSHPLQNTPRCQRWWTILIFFPSHNLNTSFNITLPLLAQMHSLIYIPLLTIPYLECV